MPTRRWVSKKPLQCKGREYGRAVQWYKYLISPALVGLERERIRVVRTRCEGFGRQEPPLRFVPLGEMRVALVSAEHARQVEAVGQGQGLRRKRRAADAGA